MRMKKAIHHQVNDLVKKSEQRSLSAGPPHRQEQTKVHRIDNPIFIQITCVGLRPPVGEEDPEITRVNHTVPAQIGGTWRGSERDPQPGLQTA